MGSQRTAAPSSFGNLRPSSGNFVSGRSRSSSCSYLSNVRPENRSTLCSVMSQLAEEMPPTFVTTLKPKAVSVNCNVKFTCVVTGHPIPQVTWYKDDTQLDRYCGLPKYEIFHNGQNHSLHIYNCCVDDAAIYQASAINSKGIVSCSGVLEVGEMNEYKIHQRYFAKLKQKVENKCRETQEKENLEPFRTISPDRMQRKRRSTMETFVSTPSPIEDKSNEEIHGAEGLEAESRLQNGTGEEVYKNPTCDTKEAVSTTNNGQKNNDSGNKGRTYMFDTDNKIFTSHQPKSPFVMKKIKISDGPTYVKTDSFGETKIMKDETSSSAAPVCTKMAQTNKNSEEVMEVQNIVSSSLTNGNSNILKEECGKLAKEEALFGKSLSKDGNMFSKRTLSSQRENLATPESSVAPSSILTVSENQVKKKAKPKNECSNKETKNNLEKQNQVSQLMPKSKCLSIIKEDIHKRERVTTSNTETKSKTSMDSSDFSELVETPCDIRAVVPQSPHERKEHLLSDKETSPCQKKESESEPAEPSQVTEANAEMEWNGAPVSLTLPVKQHSTNSEQPQKTYDILTSTLSCGPHPSTVGIPQDSSDDSRKSNGSATDIFTHPQKSVYERPSCSESKCGLSSATLQSQAIKTFIESEIQEDEKLEIGKVDKSLVTAFNETPSEANPAESTTVDTKKIQPTLTLVENCSLDCEDLKAGHLESAHGKQTPDNTSSTKDIITFTKIPKTESKVISVAELLRHQMKALELAQDTAGSTISVPSKLTNHYMTIVKEVSQQARDESTKSKPKANTIKEKNESGTSTGSPPDTNLKKVIKVNLKEKEHVLTLNETSATVQTVHKPASTSSKGTDTATDITLLCRTVGQSSEDAMEISQENVVPLKDFSVVPWSESKNLTSNTSFLPSEEKFTKKIQPISNPPETSLRQSLITAAKIKHDVQEEHGTIVEPTKDGTAETANMTTPILQTNLKNTHIVSEQSKMKEPVCNSSQRLPTNHQPEHKFSTTTQTKDTSLTEQESSVFEEGVNPHPFNIFTPEFNPLLKKADFTSAILSATPQELASGARRKIPTSNVKTVEAQESTSPTNGQTQKREIPGHSSKLSASTVSPRLSRRSPLPQLNEEQTSAAERQSPLLTRKRMASENQTQTQLFAEKIPTEGKPAQKDKHNPFKAPQVIRKIRGETLSDGSGHLKLWCQFFNVLSDSDIKWYKNEEEIVRAKKNAGDETQVNLAIVQASSKDSGVYGCSITNEYGSDTTDLLLSAEILAAMSLHEDLSVGEEMEMTPFIYPKGLADSGVWGNKLFGRIMMTESRFGEDCSCKVWRAKVIYGLEPVFESGAACLIKVRSPITYAGKEETSLVERNLHIMKQECRIQNLAREYCKILTAEARNIENFGPPPEVIPVYLMYRPANPVPYATVETDVIGVYNKYSVLDNTGRIEIKAGTEVERKCCALQHWVFQWTTGNLLLTRLEGVDTKITNVGISVKSTGYQGLSIEGNPNVFDQFVSKHKCNYYCGLLGLRSLNVMDSLGTPTKPKGSKSPLLQRKKAVSSPRPQTIRKASVSPRMPRKVEHEGNRQEDSDAPKFVNTLQT